MRAARAGQWALAAAAVLWAAALFVIPGVLVPIGAFICHQRPERSFFLHGRQLPVCARCTGLYIGAAVAAPVAIVLVSSLTAVRARRLLVVTALPTAATWLLEIAGLAHPTNAVRFIAALPLGFAAAWLVLATLRRYN